MRRSFKAFFSIVLSMAMLVSMSFGSIQADAVTPPGSSDKGDGTYSNPVIWADVPDNDVIRVGDTYWMSSTTMHINPGVPIMKSKDLVNWETVSYCYNVLEDIDAMKLQTGGNMYSNGTWASTLRYKNGTFYLIVPSNTTRKTYIFQTEDPENQPWRRYEINRQFHDCGLLMDDDGRNWLVYGNNPLYIIELNDTVTGLKEGAAQQIILPNIHAPDPVTGEIPTSGLAEGAHIRKINGKYYILCITWPSGKPRTEVCHRADSLQGPWESKVVAQESINGAGPAQGDIVDDGNGNWYGMIFRDSGAVGRIQWLMPITWVDGWPMFGKDGSYTNLPREGVIPIQVDAERKSVVSSDEFYNNAPKPVYYDADITPSASTEPAPVTASPVLAPDITDTEILPRAAVGEELVVNGGFEDADMSMWTSNDMATVTRTDVRKASGSNSAYITGRTTTGSGPAQNVLGKMVKGGVYSVSFKVYYDEDTAPGSPNTKTFNFNVKGGGSYSSTYNPIRIMQGASAAKGQWTTVSGQYTVPDDLDMSVTSVFVETNWSGSPSETTDLFNFYVDDLSVELVSLPSDPDPDDEFQWGGEYLYNGSNLNLAWQWNHNPNNRFWSLTERPGWLRLRTGFTADSILSAPNTLTQRTFGPQSAAVTVLDVTNMKAGDEAGISLFTAKYGSIGVKMEGSSKYIVTTLANSWTNPNGHATNVGTESERVVLTGNKVYLKAEANFLNQTDKGNFYYSLDGRTWTKLGGELNMTYSTNNHFMGYRFALYNFARTTTGGYVDFDYFRLDDKLTGTAAPTVLGASMTDQTGAAGIAGTIVNVPVLLDPLPGGTYSEIAASFNIPKDLTVTDVTFSESVSGNKSWEVKDNQLEIEITGDNAGFAPAARSMFAAITLKLNKLMPADTTLSIDLDYVIVKSSANVVYNVDDVKADVSFTAIDSGKAYAKKPGYSNSIISHKYGADPFAMVYDGRVYVYMTDDEAQYQLTPDTANSYGNCRSINIISSDDMVNWVDHGSVPIGKQLENGLTTWASNAWAPAAAHKVVDGKEKFFLYFADNASGIGVLTADSPIGPFEDPLGHALIGPGTAPAQGVTWLFDPAVLVDDDGTGYLYYGGGVPGGNNPTDEQKNHPGTERVIKLKDNMIETEGSAIAINAPGIFEDSGIHKYNGIYYYSYCSNFSTTIISTGTIHYMVSNHPMGPFTYVGPILPGPGGLGSQGGLSGDGGNNHHAIFEFKNKWYITYHTRQVNLAERLDQGLTGNKDYRSPSITELTYDSTGKIVPTVMEMPGVRQTAVLNPYRRVEAETIGWNYGVKTAATSEADSYVPSVNMAVTKIHGGDWIGNGQVDFGDHGAVGLSMYVAGRAGGKIEIRLDTLSGTKIGEITVPEGDGSSWQLLETSIENVTGVHDIFFKYTGSGKEELFDIDYWQFLEDTDPGDQAAAQKVIDLIKAIGKISVGSKDAIAKAEEEYNKLSAAQKLLVTNIKDLNDAKQYYNELINEKEALQKFYDTHKGKLKGNYTDSTWTAFQEALNKVKAVLSDSNADKEQIAKAETSLKAAIEGLKETTIVKAKKVTVSVAGLATNQKTGKIYVQKGKKVTVKGTVSPSQAAQGVTFQSANEKIATVSDKGVIRAKKPGTVKIVVTSKDKAKSKTITIQVLKKAKATRTLKVTSKKKLTLKVNATSIIKTKVLPKNTTYKVTYKSSKKKVAAVDEYGKITAKKKGEAVITVKCGKKLVKIGITVRK